MRYRLAVLAATLFVAAGGVAQAAPVGEGPAVLRLPAPTGPHPVGVTTLHLVDESRDDPWNPELPARDVMTTVFYPAAETSGYPVAPQMTRAAAAMFASLDTKFAHPELPDEGVDWAATMTHAHVGAPARPTRAPVLLYGPGTADPRTLGTGLAEQLASHGYVVVTMDHPGETSEVDIPGRPLRVIELPSDPRTDPVTSRRIIDTRLADTAFVLDELAVLAAGRNPDARARPLPPNLSSVLDLRRVGIYGHSVGGTVAAQAMFQDRRLDVAVNLEGYLDYLDDEPGQAGELLPVARCGTDRPLLLFGTDGFRDERYERSWWATLVLSWGRARWHQLDNATHGVFTDFAAMAPQLQDAGLMSVEERVSLVGGIEPAESVPAVRDHVVSFFDRVLRR